jgi:hypothetical protein
MHSARDVFEASLFHLKAIFESNHTQEKVEMARSAVVSAGEAIADCMLDILWIRLREAGHDPAQRRRK